MKKITFFFCALVFSISLFAATDWTVSSESSKYFIENKSQFNGRDKINNSEILFAVDEGGAQIYFTKQGLTYRFDEIESEKEEQGEEIFENEREEHKSKIETDLVHMQWENSNPNVQVTAEEETQDYFSYIVGEKNINHIKGYKKLIYTHLYPNIDVEYIFPEGKGGIKYSLILHPGADVSKVKMIYSGSSLRGKNDRSNLTADAEGNIHIPTLFGDIIDHAPFTFYQGNHKEIFSSFSAKNNVVSFSLNLPTPNFTLQTIIIDPWVQTPTLPASNCVWECERDGNGNVYVIGGDNPMKLQKYNSAGVIQWTYSTPYDTTKDWLGTFATDLNGNSYVTNGSSATIQKINTSAGLVWSVVGSNMDEYWSLAFNCDQTKLVAGGTRLVAFPSLEGYGCAFNIDLNNGKVIDTLIVASIFSLKMGNFTFNNPNEIRTICSSPNGSYYYLTPDTLGRIKGVSFTNMLSVNNSYSFGYKCENYRPNNGNAGICAIKANGKFLYLHAGNKIEQRSLSTGAVLLSANIPGGISNVNTSTTPNTFTVGNSGIDLDTCGNVYVGSGSAIVKYDANLNLLSSVSLPFAVYDVAVNNNGEVIVAGATGTSASVSRIGYVQSINMSACLPMDTSCTVSNPTIVQENSSEGMNLILENISDNQLSGTFLSPENSEMQVDIIDLQGRIIQKEKISFVKGANHLHFDLSNLNAGTYFIRLYNSTSTITARFLKL